MKVVRGYAANALGFIGDKRAFEILFIKMSDEDPKVRAYAKDALIRIGGFAVELLITRLNDSDENIRISAAQILGRLGDDTALEPLEELFFQEDNPNVRAYIVSALGFLGDSRSVELLCDALGDTSPLVRAYSVNALVRIGEPALEKLFLSLQSQNIIVIGGAAEALGIIRNERAIEPLLGVLGQDGGCGEKVREALVRIGKPSVDFIVSKLDDGDCKNKLCGIKVLGLIGDKRAVTPLCSLLLDENSGSRNSVC